MQLGLAALPVLADRPDQPAGPVGLEREDGQEVGLVERDVQLLVEHRALGLDVGDVEQLDICAAREAGVQLAAHHRPGPVAAADVAGLADLLAAVGALQPGLDALRRLLEPEQLDGPLDLHVRRPEVLDQEPLVLVLGEDQDEGEGADPLADVADRQARGLLAPHPEIGRLHLEAEAHGLLGDAELAIEFQGPRLHRQGARGGPGLWGLVDDADADAALREPQGQGEARGARTRDQDVDALPRSSRHGTLPLEL